MNLNEHSSAFIFLKKPKIIRAPNRQEDIKRAPECKFRRPFSSTSLE